jgi:hypothetical protein
MTDNRDPSEDRQSKPPIFVRMADEGNVPGLPSTKVLLFLLAVLVIGLLAVYFANASN